MIYLDTSALIKRYIWESGSEQIRGMFREKAFIVTSKIAYAEVYAAFTRRRREGDLTPIQYSRICRLFEHEWPAYLIVEVHDEILHLSRNLIKKYPLRGFDALHLASAKSIRQHLKSQLLLPALISAFWKQLRRKDLSYLLFKIQSLLIIPN